jgi:hypothetical protein
MGVALGWVAFALTGVAVAPNAECNQAQVTYTVRMVEADGVGWREAVFTRLKPVTRQGAATVWTVPRDATAQLLAELVKSPAATIVQAPKVTAQSGAAATIQCRANRPLVSQVAWNEAEPASGGVSDKVRVGWHTTMIGRKLDQGILVQVVFEDTVIRAVHHVNVPRPAKTAYTASASTRIAIPHELIGSGKAVGVYAHTNSSSMTPDEKRPSGATCTESDECCEAKENNGDDRSVQKVVLEIPEIDTQEVLGEWLVPRGETLLVSFGAHTVADKAGKAVVKERLAIIEADLAQPTDRGPGGPSQLPMITAPIPRMPESAPNVAMPTPIMPSRSIPQGVHADGTPADLPPLPADETEPDASESDSSEPLASPQTKKIPAPKPSADTGANKAEFSFPKAANMFLPNVFMPSSSAGFQFLLPMKPFSIKLPFGQKLEVEILGKIVPETTGG